MPIVAPLVVLLATLASPPDSPADLVSALESAIADAVAKADSSVVAIARDKLGDGELTTAIRGRNPLGPPEEQAPGQLRLIVPEDLDLAAQDVLSFDYGSGVVIGDAGEILTVFHVVKGASRIHVRAAGSQAFEAELIAADPRSDLAVIVPKQLPGVPPPTLRPISLGDATKLRKGCFLLALGNPFNAARDGSASASWGILANVSRRLEASLEEQQQGTLQLRHFSTLLQLDSKLNLGMSGGAVVNLKGELVGLTTAAASVSGFDVQAGYAIPIDPLARRAIDSLKQGKEVEYGFIGISLDPRIGNRIASITPGTPADRGGLHEGDTIIAVGDHPVSERDSLILAVNAEPVGRPVNLRVLREGQVLERTLFLSKMPVSGEVIATNRDAPWRGLRVDYTSTLTPGTFSREILDAMSKGSVGVVDVVTGSPAEAAGLKRGQVITAVDNQPVRTPADFAKAVSNRKGTVTITTDLGTVHIK